MARRRGHGEGTITKRGDGHYRLRVSAGRDILTGKPTRKTEEFHGTEKAARARLAQLVVEAGRGEHGGASATVADLFARWLPIAATRYSPTTWDDYERVARRFILPTIGARRLDKLRPDDLDELYRALHQSGTTTVWRARRVHEVMSAALGQAVKWRWIARNVASDASPPAPPQADVEALAPEDVVAAIEALEGRRPALAVFLRLAFVTGARRGELLALQWRDIDWERGVITFRRNVVRARAGSVVKDTKTGRERTLSIAPATVDALRDHKRRMASIDPQGWLFTKDGVDPWRPDYVSLEWRRLRGRIGVTGPLKGTRHGSATQMTAHGVDVKTGAGRTGHSRASVYTDVYAKFLPARDQAAAELLDGLLDGAVSRST